MNKKTLYRLIEEVIDENRKGWRKYKPKFREIKRLVRKEYPNALLYDEDTGAIIFKKGSETYRTDPIDRGDPMDIALDIRAMLQSKTTEDDLAEQMLDENGKKDACYHKVKARYDVWPSAYASGALSKCRKVGAANWGNKSKKKNEALDEAEITDNEKEELEDVSKQLKGAVKAHGKQAKSIDKALKKENKKNCGCGQDPCKTYGVQEAKKKAGTESSKESSLRDWFGRKGEKGSKGGWVDCNAPDGKGGYKACGRSDGEKRKKYPSCRPTPGACKEKGKGKSWGKKAAKKESLYKVIEEVIEEMNNELAEAELEEKKNSKCTKVTKKASSTRKGKKWMKCVKSDSGGYKRIHWGQAGVRVTGKSGNTKRKKSFKARHGCSKAKSNTPKGQACKDWAEE